MIRMDESTRQELTRRRELACWDRWLRGASPALPEVALIRVERADGRVDLDAMVRRAAMLSPQRRAQLLSQLATAERWKQAELRVGKGSGWYAPLLAALQNGSVAHA
jgi:hypothetical protein